MARTEILEGIKSGLEVMLGKSTRKESKMCKDCLKKEKCLDYFWVLARNLLSTEEREVVACSEKRDK